MSALAAVHWGSSAVQCSALGQQCSGVQCSAVLPAGRSGAARCALRALGAGAAAGAKHSVRHLPFLPPPCCSLPPISL